MFKLFFYPEYSSGISKNSLKRFKGKLVGEIVYATKLFDSSSQQ
jgi:hypothetical protein